MRSSRTISGLGDPTIRFTWNFIGAPALQIPEFLQKKPNWVAGASLRVGMPLGQYDPDKIFNIGLNRWSFKPEVGASKTWGHWTFEGAVGVTFFTDNDDYFGGTTREQDPLLAAQAHVIYTFSNGVWVGIDGTYYDGGQTTVGGTIKDDRQANSRFGATLSYPLNRKHSLKLYGSAGGTARFGGNFNTVGVSWMYRWGGVRKDFAPQPQP